LDELNELGFTYDLTFTKKIFKKPDKYEIVHVYRYEGDSNPDDEAVVLVLNRDQVKGVFVTVCCKLKAAQIPSN
jgi:hypothetical protein